MFANSSTLSSTAAVFQPQGVAAMEYQYYGQQMNSYDMGSYHYGYDHTYCSNHYSNGGFHLPQKQEVLNLDDFSDLSDSDEESAPIKVAKDIAADIAEVSEIHDEQLPEPAEEPSPLPCAMRTFNFKETSEAETPKESETETPETLSSASSASSEPENEEEASPVYSVRLLLNLRAPLSTEEPLVLYRTEPVPEEKPETKTPEKLQAPKEIRARKKPQLQHSENSWAAQQRRAKTENSSDSKEQVARSIKSILNKLTLEKFSSLSQQLLTCGISSAEHLVVLIHEVFEKATTQHHFIDMYADLCVLLHEHFTAKPLEDGKKLTFKRLLLDECQSSFERLLTPPSNLEQLPTEEKTAAEMSYKTHMLGNIKLVGGLLARGMLASKVGIAILEELLSNPTPEALESVAALLTALGSSCDRPEWPQHVALTAIFQDVALIVKGNSCPTRERCLLKDLLDLRRNGWVDRRPKKMERAMTLKQVAENKELPKPQLRKVAVVAFDQEKFRAAAQRLLRELQTAQLNEVFDGFKALGMPPASKQPHELAELLCLVVQEKAALRDLGFQLLSQIAGEWHSEALAQGVLLMGRAGAGKTSMKSIIFANYHSRQVETGCDGDLIACPIADTKMLQPTNHVEHNSLRFLGNLRLNLWDCGGQDQFMENYFESQRENIFQHCEVLIYVLVAARDKNPGNDERKKDVEYFKDAIESLTKHSPNATTFVLIHKLDLVHESKRAEVYRQVKEELLTVAPERAQDRITFMGTSIWDDTLFKAWSKIVAVMVPDPDVLQAHVNFMCQQLMADEVVIFEKNTFLVITRAHTKEMPDQYRFEKLSNIIKQYKLSCQKAKTNFRNFVVKNDRFRAII
ncbi:unnamed protein product, partial [Durusdinium trenchii]